MRASVRAHWATKRGNTVSEYEDAWSVSTPSAPDEEIDARGWCCALADGASESMLAGRWAAELARVFSARAVGPRAVRDPVVFANVAGDAVQRWPGIVARYVGQRAKRGNPLKWYEKPGLEHGAYATLLTLAVAADGPGTAEAGTATVTWEAAALGDSCAFQVRDERLLAAFPVADSRDFGTSPDLVTSQGTDPQLLCERVAFAKGDLVQGDDLFLCTDAAAAWFLASWEEGRSPWHDLRDLGTELDVDAWLERERTEGRMRNDDVTLVHLDVW